MACAFASACIPGDIQPSGGDYFGNPVNRTARIEAAAHGGMILMSEDTAQRLQDDLPDGAGLIDHGFHRLKDLGASPQTVSANPCGPAASANIPALTPLSRKCTISRRK